MEQICVREAGTIILFVRRWKTQRLSSARKIPLTVLSLRLGPGIIHMMSRGGWPVAG